MSSSHQRKKRRKEAWKKYKPKLQLPDDFPVYTIQLTRQQFLNEIGIYFSQKEFNWLILESKKFRYRCPSVVMPLRYQHIPRSIPKEHNPEITGKKYNPNE